MKQPDNTWQTATARSPQTADDPPVVLAKHAIRELEKALARDFDVRAVMGVELEFTLLPKQDKSNLPKDFFGILNENKSTALGDNPSSVTRDFRSPLAINNPDPWFPDSARVNRTYPEDETKTPWIQFEVVLSHEPERMKLTAEGSSRPRAVVHNSLTLARSIEALRYRIQNPTAGTREPKKPSAVAGYYKRTSNYVRSLGEAQVAYWHDVHQNDVAAISFAASAPDQKTLNSLHLNMSLETIKGGMIAEKSSDKADGDALLSRLALGVGKFMESSLYLLGSSPSAYERWHHNPGKTYTRYCVLEKDYGNVYIENKLPPADCNPYYAVMLQLAATYHALQAQQFRYNPDTKHYEINKTECPVWHNEWTPEANQRFLKNDSNLGKVLNHIEPTLGDRFMAAIEQCPPGTEKTAMDNRHEGLGNPLAR